MHSVQPHCTWPSNPELALKPDFQFPGLLTFKTGLGLGFRLVPGLCALVIDLLGAGALGVEVL